MIPDAAYEEGVGRIPPQGGPKVDRTATTEVLVRRMVLPPYGGCNGGIGVAGDGDLRLRPPEHSSAICCN